MATPKFNSKSPTIRRILREAQELSTSPSPDYAATPLESDLFEWHFTLRGPPNSPFAEGLYHGRIVLPPTYPLRPPSFRFLTPSGRFETNREICLSISGHHEETWQPAWGLRTALVALRSFMETEAKGQVGGLDTGESVRSRLAGESRKWKCATCGKANEVIMAETEEAARLAQEQAGGAASGAKEEVEVPPELRMAFKDELGKNVGTNSRPSAEATEAGPASTTLSDEAAEDSESAELAEAFVQTVTMQDLQPRILPSPQEAQRLTADAPRSARHLAQPASPHASEGIQQRTTNTQMAQRREVTRNAFTPGWIDKVIMALGFCLAAMIIKVLLGL